jgi:peptide/nickel transport system substrate-binding protein
VSFDVSRGARLERNPRFGSESPPARPDGFADAIAVTFSPPAPDRDIAAVEHGEADLVSLQAGYERGKSDRIRGLLTRHAGRLEAGQQLTTDFMFLNVREPPFDDIRVRRAVNFATDRREVAELAGGPEIARPTCQLLPPGMPGYRPFCPWTQDPSPGGEWSAPDLARARRLIARSGTRGQNVPVWTPREFSELARYYAGLMRRLGYRSSIRVLPSFPAYFPVVGDSRRHVQMGVFGWLADYVAPSNMIAPEFTCAARVPRSPSNSNVSQFCDPRVDAMIRRALDRPATDPSATASQWHAIDRRLVSDAPAIPLVNGGDAVLLANRVGNVQQHPFWGTLLDQLWVR